GGAPHTVVPDPGDALGEVELRRVALGRRTGQVVDRAGHEIDVPASPNELGEVVPVAIEARRVQRRGVLVDTEKSRHEMWTRSSVLLSESGGSDSRGGRPAGSVRWVARRRDQAHA